LLPVYIVTVYNIVSCEPVPTGLIAEIFWAMCWEEMEIAKMKGMIYYDNFILTNIMMYFNLLYYFVIQCYISYTKFVKQAIFHARLS